MKNIKTSAKKKIKETAKDFGVFDDKVSELNIGYIRFFAILSGAHFER